MPPSDLAVTILAGAIVFAGHLVKGVTGFGSALFAVPLLLLILDVKFVSPVFLLFDVTSGAILVTRTWRSVERRLLLLIWGGMLVGTGLGTWVLLSFSHEVLKRVLGVLVGGWALATLLRKEPHARSLGRSVRSYLAPVSGFLGGALGAMFSVNGPPIIIYLSHVLDEKQAFRATLYAVFFADACYKMVLFTANRLLNQRVFCFALTMAPFLVAGILIGSWLQRLLDEELFRRIVAAILVVTGVVLLI
ncbi:MAG: sulfite exporter TauE/SafE family protein [Chloroflexota bacterium]